MPNVLPDSILPSRGNGITTTNNNNNSHENIQLTSDHDFDRSLHKIRKHYSYHNTITNKEYPLFDPKTRSSYEPEYPRYSQTARVPGSYDYDRPAMIPHYSQRKSFPKLSNIESLREGMYSIQPEGAPTNIPCVMKVADPATGKLIRFRRGIEVDFLKSAGVPHIQRYQEDYRTDEDILHRRNGIGFSKQMDRYYRTVEMSNNYFTDKPGRWWSDPNGRTAKVQMMNTVNNNNNNHTAKATNFTNGRTQHNNNNTGSISARIGPSQQEANKAAIKALRTK